VQSNCVETSQFLAQGHRKCHHSIACIWFPILDTKLGFWELWGYLATSGAKSDVIFLLGDPNFLLGRRNFASISLSYRDPHFGLFGFLGVLGATRVTELTQNVIRSSHDHSTPSLKISCKSVQPFSRNLADKETNKQIKERNKQTKKERKKSSVNNTPLPVPTGAG